MSSVIGGPVSDASQANLAPASARGTELAPAEARIFETATSGLGNATAQEDAMAAFR
jgi:hypothetical protein